jgi:serine/threonine protein kinase
MRGLARFDKWYGTIGGLAPHLLTNRYPPLKLCPECFAEFEDSFSHCPADSSPLSAIDNDPLLGTKLSERYQLLSVIGRGGMGVVYKARHETMDRFVAIKMLHAHLVSDAEAIKRFHREAKAVSRVKHPNTVSLFDFGISTAGQPYIVMDYIDGHSLKKVLKQEGALSLDRVAHIFGQVIPALACAHREGVVHRDLKPENIMLTVRANVQDFVEVVDFGISKLKSKENHQTYNITRVGDVCGSPPYMSPEQCLASLPIDSRSDVYSLGIVLYEAISGRLPFKAKTAIEMIDCHLYGVPAPLKASNPELASCEALNALLTKALQKEPENRQQSMEELGKELEEAIRRDMIKLQSYRIRSSGATHVANEAKALAEAGGIVESQRDTSVLTVDRAPAQNGSWARPRTNPIMALFGGILSLFGKRNIGGHGPDYVLLNCPFCNALVDPNIRFCLDCGRNLASSHELSKLRSIQGVFTLPKSHTVQPANPEFSNKAKRVMSRSGGLFGLPRAFVAFNLFMLFAIAVIYFGQNGDIHAMVKNSADKLMGQTKPAAAPHKLISSSPNKHKKRNKHLD